MEGKIWHDMRGKVTCTWEDKLGTVEGNSHQGVKGRVQSCGDTIMQTLGRQHLQRGSTHQAILM